MSLDQVRGWLLLLCFLRAYPWGFFEAIEAAFGAGPIAFCGVAFEPIARIGRFFSQRSRKKLAKRKPDLYGENSRAVIERGT